MISPMFSHLLIPFIIAMVLAVTMGGSGTAPAFSAFPCCSYGWLTKMAKSLG